MFSKARLLISTAIVFITFYSSAQHNAAVKLQTFRIIDGLYTVSFEQAFNKHFSPQLSIEAGHYINEQLNRYEKYKVSGLGVIGAARYYPFTQKFGAPRGFFAYAAVRHISYRDEYMNSNTPTHFNGHARIINVGGGAGYKFVYRRFGVEGFVGWGAGRLTRKGDVTGLPEFFQDSMIEYLRFAQLDVAVCYMLRSFGSN